MNNFAQLVKNNIEKIFSSPTDHLVCDLPAEKKGDSFEFQAFGERCRLGPDGIMLGEEAQKGILGILISLYACHACPDSFILEPFKAYKDFPNSMPYVGAFTTHTEHILVRYVEKIQKNKAEIIEILNGDATSPGVGGDVSFILQPLPKIKLCYVFYLADEDFPASVTCLYSNNAATFLPMDALADVGEYTSRKIIDVCS